MRGGNPGERGVHAPASAAARAQRDLHRAQAVEQARLHKQGPPVVQEDLERPPQRDPPADHQALLDDRRERLLRPEAGEKLGGAERRGEEREPDRETDATGAEELPEGAACARCALPKVLVHGLAEQRALGVRGRVASEADGQAERLAGAGLPRPFNDVLVGVWIELALVEGRRIHRVKSCRSVATCRSSTSRPSSSLLASLRSAGPVMAQGTAGCAGGAATLRSSRSNTVR